MFDFYREALLRALWLAIKLHDVCRRVLKHWYWTNGVGVITFALHFEVKKLPKRELKKHFNEELEKNVEDKNSINTSTSTQFAPHTWQIIGLKRVMLLRTRINWRSLLETVTLSDSEVFSLRNTRSAGRRIWTIYTEQHSTGRVWEEKKFRNHFNRGVKHDHLHFLAFCVCVSTWWGL